MKFRVSEKYLRKKKIEPIYSSLWGLLIGALFFGTNDSIPWYVSVSLVALMIALTGGPNWLGSKRTIESFKDHLLEIDDNRMILSGQSVTSEVDLNSIYRVILDKKKNKVTSIFIEMAKGQKVRLPPYENMDDLANCILNVVPQEKVKVRGWFHL